MNEEGKNEETGKNENEGRKGKRRDENDKKKIDVNFYFFFNAIFTTWIKENTSG